jgi:hypothetical protein
MTEQAKQTPLVELLDAVPEDVRIGVQDGEVWHAGTTWHPVGRLCLDAAAKLRRLRAVNAELLEALKFYGSSCDATESTPCGYEGNLCCKRARAAIARAEGELNERP